MENDVTIPPVAGISAINLGINRKLKIEEYSVLSVVLT